MGWWCRMGGGLARRNHSLGSPRNLSCKITQNVSLDIFQVNSSESMLFLCKENPKDCYLMASHYRSFLFINYYSSDFWCCSNILQIIDVWCYSRKQEKARCRRKHTLELDVFHYIVGQNPATFQLCDLGQGVSTPQTSITSWKKIRAIRPHQWLMYEDYMR